MVADQDQEILRAGGLEIHAGGGLVLAAGAVLAMPVREFQLLVELVRREGSIVSREALYQAVWGGQLRDGDRSVDVYVHKLRTRLGRSLPGRTFIHTHPGFGYRFSPQPSHAGHTTATSR